MFEQRAAASGGAAADEAAAPVLHVDVDAFFVQVEQLRDPSLVGKAVAVQQHTDIIAVNAAAKAAGVRKHCAPSDARRALAAVGGRVVHVHLAGGYRISYGPYREASQRLMQLLERSEDVAVVEKASIDEAFVLLRRGGGGGGGGGERGAAGADAACGAAQPESNSAGAEDMAHALRVGESIRAACQRELGLTVSVGIARNCLLAKLTSAFAKPDGILVTDGAAAVDALLARTPVERLPGFGGRVAEQLRKLGCATAKAVQGMSQAAAEDALALKPELAQRLLQYAHGRDSRVVAKRGPPRTISLQMTLTPVELPMHPAWTAQRAVGGSAAGRLLPLMLRGSDAPGRMHDICSVMIGDLIARVAADRDEEGRWPTSFVLTIKTHGEGGRSITKSAAFPPPASLASASATSNGSDLHAALLSAAGVLFQGMVVSGGRDNPVTQVHVGATNFVSESAASSTLVSSYFTPQKRKRPQAGSDAPPAEPPLPISTAAVEALATPAKDDGPHVSAAQVDRQTTADAAKRVPSCTPGAGCSGRGPGPCDGQGSTEGPLVERRPVVERAFECAIDGSVGSPAGQGQPAARQGSYRSPHRHQPGVGGARATAKQVQPQIAPMRAPLSSDTSGRRDGGRRTVGVHDLLRLARAFEAGEVQCWELDAVSKAIRKG